MLELVGQSTDAYNYMLTDSKKMNAKQMEEFWGLHPEMYSQFNNGKKYKTIRKEELKGDRLVFLVDEKGVKTSILQSKLNDQLAQKHDQELLDEYNKLNPKKEPIEYKKDPLIKKVLGRRFKRAIQEKGNYLSFPDLVLIDGGKGQYSSARETLNDLGLNEIPVIVSE